MKARKIGTSCFAAVAGLAVSLGVGSASASLLLYEGFDYTGGSNLVGQNGGDWDPARAWTSGGASNGSLNGANVVLGLSLGDFPTVGGAAKVVQNHNGASGGGTYETFAAARQLPGDTATVLAGPTDVWVSFLFRQDQDGSFANEAQLSFSDSIAGSGQKLQSRTVTQFGDDNPDNIATGPANGVGTSSGAVVALDTTYLVVSKFTNVNGSTFSSNTATMWLLDEGDWDAIKASPSEALLDANNLARVDQAPGNTFVVGVADTDYLRLNTRTGFGINNRSIYDEIRVGTSIDSVLIPEPGALALAGLGGAAMLIRRRTA